MLGHMGIAELTHQMLASYASAGGINHIDGKNLPSKRAIGVISADLLRLLFPGFFDERIVHSSKLELETASLLASIASRLEDEIAKSLEYAPPSGVKRRELASLAQAQTQEFLASLPGVREVLRTDAEAAYNGDPAALSKEEVIVAYPFMEAIALQRAAHQLYRRQIALIPRIMTEWAHTRTGLDIHPGAQIGSHFFVDHCTGTVIGETTVIGNQVKLYQGVGLVARSLSGGQQLRGKKRHPTLEDRVTIYAGTTIVGGETVIGAGSTIGANVFLLHSVPPNSLVTSDEVKAKVMSKEQRGEGPEDYSI
jgi:serine O-acetyltransferase